MFEMTVASVGSIIEILQIIFVIVKKIELEGINYFHENLRFREDRKFGNLSSILYIKLEI